VPLLIITGSRTAQGLAVLAAGMAVLMYAQRRTFVRHRTGTYLALAAAAIGVVTLVAGIGMKTGGLFHDSLTFRWRYWVGSAAMIAARPLTGVGWENFGETYVQYRVPGAIEEIKDPHNLLVKFATETGLPGLVLLIATLGVAAWEVGRRAPALTRTRTGEALRPAAWVVGAFVAAHVATRGFALLDFTELLKLVLFAALLGAAVLVGSVRSLNDFVLEGGRSRWVGGGAVLALLIFLAHNFVDFALFETGPMLMFMATLGACLGIRAGRRRVKRNTPAALASLAVLALLALSFALLIVLPVGLAESHAAAARQLTTENKTDRAAASWRAAIDASPVANAHYALEAGEAYRSSRQPRPREAIAFLSQAVEADPRLLRGWLERARARRSYGLVRDEAELNAIETDYRTALRLDPQAIDARVEYAQFLDSAGRSSRALEEYRAALAMSDRLPAHEIRRLSPANADAVRQRIAALGGGQ
jgi:tetratricopeptide (TPR) repeat protein